MNKMLTLLDQKISDLLKEVDEFEEIRKSRDSHADKLNDLFKMKLIYEEGKPIVNKDE